MSNPRRFIKNMTNEYLTGFLQNTAKLRSARTGRASSWDQSGKNQDYWVIPPGEEVVLAELIGPGCITHFWMTQFCRRLIGQWRARHAHQHVYRHAFGMGIERRQLLQQSALVRAPDPDVLASGRRSVVLGCEGPFVGESA